MPFTFSHPALVLPLAYLPKKWFSMTGLIIGSIAPDFEYFIRMRIQSDYSHTISGLFWFDLPLGIILAFIFHNIVRDSFFNNLPTILKSRLVKFKSFEWNEYFKKNWLVVIISFLIGAASHIFWDSFTHHNGYFVKTIPTLTNTVAFIGMQVPIYKILQHSSTIIGGLIVVFALYKITPDKNVTGKLNTTYWGVFSMLTLTIVAIRLISGLDFKLYGHLLATVISAGLISLTLTPILTRQRE